MLIRQKTEKLGLNLKVQESQGSPSVGRKGNKLEEAERMKIVFITHYLGKSMKHAEKKWDNENGLSCIITHIIQIRNNPVICGISREIHSQTGSLRNCHA